MTPARRVARRTARRTSRRMGAAGPEPERTAASAPADEAPAEQDDVAQIQQLATMKDQGLLTDEEFQAKKKLILGI
jgi:Short C-terminal domain